MAPPVLPRTRLSVSVRSTLVGSTASVAIAAAVRSAARAATRLSARLRGSEPPPSDAGDARCVLRGRDDAAHDGDDGAARACVRVRGAAAGARTQVTVVDRIAVLMVVLWQRPAHAC